jgi:hypothetical protein
MISKCEKKLKYTYSPGLNYCKGMYLRCIGEINKSLQEFSKSKTDEYYGAKCLEQMLEIYINPDNDILLIDYDNPFKYEKSSSGLINYRTQGLNMEAITFLLSELKLRRSDERTMVYEAYVAMLSKNKAEIEAASGTLQDILQRNPENLPAWSALASANLILLKVNEVKINLKQVQKAKPSIKYITDYERGYLLDAYSCMITDNTKRAEEILTKICTEIKCQSK